MAGAAGWDGVTRSHVEQVGALMGDFHRLQADFTEMPPPYDLRDRIHYGLGRIADDWETFGMVRADLWAAHREAVDAVAARWALRAGNQIYVTGTAPVGEDGRVVAPGDGYEQAKRCFEIIDQALKDLGADLSCVVRTRMFVTDISRWADYGHAHREAFAGHPPATTMVEVRSLIDAEMLIEIEADAIC